MSTASPVNATTRRPAGGVRRRRRWVWVAAGLWLLLMAPLAWWGLPSTRSDPLLFGDQPAWTAEQYGVETALQALQTQPVGADTDLNPLDAERRTTPILLTTDEPARAELLVRYRLYSRQPDEMITFRALARMDPRHGRLDPQLYQYGGAYIYLVGAALGAASLSGWVELTRDLGVFLVSPERFARYYVVARLLSLVCGALLLIAGYRLGRRLGGPRAGWSAMLLIALAPVFITMAVEAKPHLPSACALLWATVFALRYHDRPRYRTAAAFGACAGLAAGFVLTGVVAGVTWLALVATLRQRRRRATRVSAPDRWHLVSAAVIAVATYVATNPYVVYNTLVQRGVLESNLGNSLAMYRIGAFGHGAANVAGLLIEGAGVATVLLGALVVVLLARRHGVRTLIVTSAGAALLLIAVALGAGKPAEFGRFLLLPAVLLAVAAAVGVAWLWRWRRGWGVGALLACALSTAAPAYVRSLALDAWSRSESRQQAGRWLAARAAPDDTFGVFQEPAPYAVPPLDLAQRHVVLLPQRPPAGLAGMPLPRWLVFTADRDRLPDPLWAEFYRPVTHCGATGLWRSRITWAHKPVFIYERIDGE
jgi:hypothetical protein